MNGFTGENDLYCFREDDIVNTYPTNDNTYIGNRVYLSYRTEPIVIIGNYRDSYVTSAAVLNSPNCKKKDSSTGINLYDYVGVSYYNGYLGDRYIYCFMEDDIDGLYIDKHKVNSINEANDETESN